MLLLVLVLVLIAFGLLVVALLSGSVLWAWISVAVSVAAAAALLVDWLQRRSAVKAGAESQQPAGAAAAAPQGGPQAPRRDIEPVTEVLPVLGQGSPGRVPPPTAGVERGQSSSDSGAGAGSDAEATSVMPRVGPSGSADRPSGAVGDDTRSSDSASRSVTGDESHVDGAGRHDSPSGEREIGRAHV